MTTREIIGYGGGRESNDTVKARVFLLTFLKKARSLIKNVDIELHNEYPVYCPPQYRNEEGRRYQTDIAVILPGFDQYNFAIEIDGRVGHNFKASNIIGGTTKDDLRDAWIYKANRLPIFRLKLDWILYWRKNKDYLGCLDELEHRHRKFAYDKLPKNPLIHIAKQNKGVFVVENNS